MLCLQVLSFEKTHNLPYILGRIKLQISIFKEVQGKIIQGFLCKEKYYFILMKNGIKWRIDGRLIRAVHKLKYKKKERRKRKKLKKFSETRQLKLFN